MEWIPCAYGMNTSAYRVNHLDEYGYTWMLRQINSGMTLDQG